MLIYCTVCNPLKIAGFVVIKIGYEVKTFCEVVILMYYTGDIIIMQLRLMNGWGSMVEDRLNKFPLKLLDCFHSSRVNNNLLTQSGLVRRLTQNTFKFNMNRSLNRTSVHIIHLAM